MAGRADEHTLAEWFARRAQLSSDARALSFDRRDWTYRQLQSRIERVAAVLASGGVAPGDRVGYLGGNHPDCLVALFAAAHLGAIFVPLNTRLTTAELTFIIDDAAIHTLLVGPDHAVLGAGFAHMRMIGVGREGSELDRLADAAVPVGRRPIVAADVATIIYTSGTTGAPKGAMLTHGNLWANAINWILAFGIDAGDVTLTMAPLFHVSGLFVLTTSVLLVGGRVVLLGAFDAGKVIATIAKERITTTFGVPAMMLFMSQHETFDTADLSSLRLVVAGGAPVSEPLLRRYAARGVPVSHCYGMSEVVSACTYLETERAAEKLNSAGRAMMLCEIRLIDEIGEVIDTPGVKGEICVRGASVMAGYWKRPEATAAAIDADGWVRSGDVGHLDSAGFLYVSDRVKDMIISGGENIYPAEVESVLFDHPAVANAAIIGAADERWGERVVAVVVTQAGAELTLDELQAFCGERLARYKLPRELHVVESLPLNGSGKVVKRALRELLAAPRAGGAAA